MPVSATPLRRARLRRARLRRREGGAVLFIVAVTLGLLAVMGVYGLSAASNDVRSAGEMRQALQGQRAGEAGIMMTAETFNPAMGPKLVAEMSKNAGQSTGCVTAAPYTGNESTRLAEACLKLDPTQMKLIASQIGGGGNSWASSGTAQPGFTPQSLGSVPNQPFVTMEITNPIDVNTGTYSKAFHFVQLTATVFVQSKPIAGTPAVALVKGRGRITVGPMPGANGGLVAAF